MKIQPAHFTKQAGESAFVHLALAQFVFGYAISQIWRIATRHGRKVRYPCGDSPKTTKATPQLLRLFLMRFSDSVRI